MAKILLVDDDPLMLRMYQKKLVNDGYEVKTATNGLEAFEEMLSFTPDLILLDIMMPKMNGFEVLKKLKEDTDTNTIPVIILTNVGSSQEDVDKGLELGAVAYLTKAGNRPNVVVSKVKEILDAYTKDDIPEVKSEISEQ